MAKIHLKRFVLQRLGVVCVCLVVLALMFQLQRVQQSFYVIKDPSQMKTDLPGVTKPKVLLLTYLRSGSTFVADVFQRSPNAFYAFEPIRFLLRTVNAGNGYYTKHGVCSLLGECRKSELLEENAKFVTDVVSDMYMCKQSNIPSAVVHWMSFAPQTKISSRHKYCVNKTSNVQHCNGVIFKNCSAASSYVFKFIRLSAEVVGDIMENVADLKVIHLLRDPRGILRSRQRLGFLSNHTYEFTSKLLCSQMLTDIIETKRLQTIYPGRIKTLLYEDMAENPIEGAKRLYEFTRFNFTKDIESYVYNITMAGHPNNYAYGTVRSNSKKVAYEWRESTSFENIHMVDTSCKSLYSVMGLKPIETADMVQDFTYFSRVKEHNLGDYLML